jgi:hypothetical protein
MSAEKPQPLRGRQRLEFAPQALDVQLTHPGEAEKQIL